MRAKPVVKSWLIHRWFSVWLGALLFSLTAYGAATGSPKRVLVLDPFGRNVAPFTTAVSSFRTTLARELGEPVDIYELPLELARFSGPEGETPLVTFLEGRLKEQPVDLVVPVGTAGMQFAARHRDRLFPDTPVLVMASEPRMMSPELLKTNATAVTQRVSLPGMVEDILRLQPQTTNIVVVLGASALERFWTEQCRREFQVFTNRVGFTWVNDLTLEEIVNHCSALPPNSFVLHALFIVDAAGVPCEKNEALRRLHEVASAPVFGFYTSEFGLGSIGGRLFQDTEVGAQAALTAVRILRGERPESIPPQILEATAPIYDWRELQRWGISEANLPVGSVIQFRQPTFWERYHWLVIGTSLLCFLQGALIVGLWVNRSQRKQGEAEATLLADISSKFVNLPPHEVDREIIDAQRRICQFLDLDLSVLWQVQEDNTDFIATHAYQREESSAPSQPFRQEDFPWVRSEMNAGRMVTFTKVTELPAQAAKDKESASSLGIKSTLTIPLSVGGEQTIGVLSFNALRQERPWPESLINRLQLAAQIFANALARKRADHALRESELRLQMATDSAGAGLWLLEWSSGEFWANAKARSIFGYTADEPLSLARFEASVIPEDWMRVRDSISNAAKTGAPVDVEYRIKLADGTDRWIASRGRPFFKANGEPERLVGLSLDITGQRKAEVETKELRNALAHSDRVSALGHLASALAHELSQPLGAILRNAEAAEIMLQEPSPDLEELRAIVTDILRDDHRAGEVIDRLRSLLKRGKLSPLPVDLGEVVGEVLSLVRGDAAARRVRVESSLAPNLPLILGDKIHLQQVLINLLVNAMDALAGVAREERLVRVTIRPAGAAALEVEVADNGHGIASEHLPHLFEPFFTTKGSGMGVGLAVSKTIIEAHKGKLLAENDPAGGACFRFTVPVVPAAAVPLNIS